MTVRPNPHDSCLCRKPAPDGEAAWTWSRCAEWLKGQGVDYTVSWDPGLGVRPLHLSTFYGAAVSSFGAPGAQPTAEDWREMTAAWCEADGKAVPWEEAAETAVGDCTNCAHLRGNRCGRTVPLYCNEGNGYPCWTARTCENCGHVSKRIALGDKICIANLCAMNSDPSPRAQGACWRPIDAKHPDGWQVAEKSEDAQPKTCAPHGWAASPERLHAYAATLYDDHWAEWLHSCADAWEAAKRDRDEARAHCYNLRRALNWLRERGVAVGHHANGDYAAMLKTPGKPPLFSEGVQSEKTFDAELIAALGLEVEDVAMAPTPAPPDPEPDAADNLGPQWLRDFAPAVSTAFGPTTRDHLLAHADAWAATKATLVGLRSYGYALRERNRHIAEERDEGRASASDSEAFLKAADKSRAIAEQCLRLLATGKVVAHPDEAYGWSAHVPGLNVRPATGPDLAQCVHAAWESTEGLREAMAEKPAPEPDEWQPTPEWLRDLWADVTIHQDLGLLLAAQRPEDRERLTACADAWEDDRKSREYWIETSGIVAERDEARADCARITAEYDDSVGRREYWRTLSSSQRKELDALRSQRTEAEKCLTSLRNYLSDCVDAHRADIADASAAGGGQSTLVSSNLLSCDLLLLDFIAGRITEADLRAGPDWPDKATARVEDALRVVADLRRITERDACLVVRCITSPKTHPVALYPGDEEPLYYGAPGQPWQPADIAEAAQAVCGEAPASPAQPCSTCRHQRGSDCKAGNVASALPEGGFGCRHWEAVDDTPDTEAPEASEVCGEIPNDFDPVRTCSTCRHRRIDGCAIHALIGGSCTTGCADWQAGDEKADEATPAPELPSQTPEPSRRDWLHFATHLQRALAARHTERPAESVEHIVDALRVLADLVARLGGGKDAS